MDNVICGIHSLGIRGSRDGVVVRALASHQCGPCSIPSLCIICGLTKYKEGLRFANVGRVALILIDILIRFLPHMNHVSVSPTNGNGPTEGQRKTLTRVGIEPTTSRLDHHCSAD